MESNCTSDYYIVLIVAYEREYGRLDNRHDLSCSLAHWKTFLYNAGLKQEGLTEFNIVDTKRHLLAKLKYGI